MIEQTYRIDMIPNGVPLVVHVSQYDTEARTLIFELYKGDVAYEVPAGAVASIAGTKPDKTAFIYPMTIDGNVVSIDLKQQMALVAGDVPAEIQITGAEGKIGSANFIIRVERGPIDENSVISETDLPIFEQMVSDAQAAANEAQTAAEDAAEAASSVGSIVPASAGTAGQVLTKTANGADWADKYPSGGTAGQVLTKTANGADWANIGCPFPIGYGGFFQTDPNTIYAGTKWEQKKDVFILASGDTYQSGSTGGEAEHVLTVNEMPIHEHGVKVRVQGYDAWETYTSSNYGVMFKMRADATGYHSPNYSARSASVEADADTGRNGGSQPHNNMPPYFAMPFWIRTA